MVQFFSSTNSYLVLLIASSFTDATEITDLNDT